MSKSVQIGHFLLLSVNFPHFAAFVLGGDLLPFLVVSSVTSFPGSMREAVLREVSPKGRGPHRSPSGRTEAELLAESPWARDGENPAGVLEPRRS